MIRVQGTATALGAYIVPFFSSYTILSESKQKLPKQTYEHLGIYTRTAV